eukprot:gb/GECG01009168.1/.p1 GENE.gb/GECG01009168.1/~~gb/GECG01009168.1/.p1  ORF type:complete len:280 (+),score=23.99 gb/GECG01009168.1/:1-840(+)
MSGDIVRYRKDPLRHRKRPFDHLRPTRLVLTVFKNTAMKLSHVSNSAMEQDKDPAEAIAEYSSPQEALYLIGPAIAKDISVISVQRLFEYLALQLWDEKTAGRFMRDPSKEALYKVQKKRDPDHEFKARLQAAYSMFMVGARSAVIPCSAIYTVEETIIIGTVLWKKLRRDQLKNRAEKRLHRARAMQSELYRDPNTSHLERERVGYELKKSLQQLDSIEKDYRIPPWKDVINQSLSLFVRSVGSVASEGTGVALGTLIWPGIGTTVGQFVGSIACWMI